MEICYGLDWAEKKEKRKVKERNKKRKWKRWVAPKIRRK